MSIVDVWPSGSMALLTQSEADALSLSSKGELYELYRNCSLAVLNSGNITDNSKELLDNFSDFEISIIRNCSLSLSLSTLQRVLLLKVW